MVEDKPVEELDSCPSFGKDYDADAEACQDCETDYPKDFVECCRLCAGGEPELEAEPEVDEPVVEEVVEPEVEPAPEIIDEDEEINPEEIEEPEPKLELKSKPETKAEVETELTELDDKPDSNEMRDAPSKISRDGMIIEMLREDRHWNTEELVSAMQDERPKGSFRQNVLHVSGRIPFLMAIGAIVPLGDNRFELNPVLRGK